MTEDYTSIDTSEWIKNSSNEAVKQRQYRIAKGDMINVKGIWQVEYEHPVDKLLANETISGDEYQAALRIIYLKHALETALGLNRRPKPFFIGEGSGVCPTMLYGRVMKNMCREPYQWHMVGRICFEDVRPNDWGWIYQCSGSIQKSFESLAKALDYEYEMLQNADIAAP